MRKNTELAKKGILNLLLDTGIYLNGNQIDTFYFDLCFMIKIDNITIRHYDGRVVKWQNVHYSKYDKYHGFVLSSGNALTVAQFLLEQ